MLCSGFPAAEMLRKPLTTHTQAPAEAAAAEAPPAEAPPAEAPAS